MQGNSLKEVRGSLTALTEPALANVFIVMLQSDSLRCSNLL
jgi:hypothetical protein